MVGAPSIAWQALTQPSASMGAFRVTFGCGPVLSHRRKASNHAESSSHQKEHSWSTFAHIASPILAPCYRTCFKSFCLLAAEGGTDALCIPPGNVHSPDAHPTCLMRSLCHLLDTDNAPLPKRSQCIGSVLSHAAFGQAPLAGPLPRAGHCDKFVIGHSAAEPI